MRLCVCEGEKTREYQGMVNAREKREQNNEM